MKNVKLRYTQILSHHSVSYQLGISLNLYCHNFLLCEMVIMVISQNCVLTESNVHLKQPQMAENICGLIRSTLNKSLNRSRTQFLLYTIFSLILLESFSLPLLESHIEERMSVIQPCTQSLSAISGCGWSLWLMVFCTQWIQASICLKRKEKIYVNYSVILLRTL